MAKEKETSKPDQKELDEFRGQLLGWYDRHSRDLPWRYKNGAKADPYKVWLSEIMCQQTTVQAVIPYFLKFTELWPTIQSLANAPLEEVMKEWAGLGYYARARNLHKCAGVVANDLGGNFPGNQKDLQKLPGIGDYTSAAITAIALNQPAVVVDGNVERVIARYHAVTNPVPKSKPFLKKLATPYYEGFHDRPADLPQAFMDLGASICTPKPPKCMICPIAENCQGRIQNIAKTLPAREKKKPNPQKHGYVYWIENEAGEILLERRNPKFMLGGMPGFPTSEWVGRDEELKHLEFIAPHKLEHIKLPFITHTFTHFDLKLFLIKGSVKTPPAAEFFWSAPGKLHDIGLPTLFKKAYKLWLHTD